MSNVDLEEINTCLNKILSFFNIVISLNDSFDLTDDIISVTEVYRDILKKLIYKIENIREY